MRVVNDFVEQELSLISLGHGEAIVIHCVDKRHSKPGGSVRDLLPQGYDFTFVGGCLRLVTRISCRTEFREQVEDLITVANKDIRRIYIVDHYCAEGKSGCAAYGVNDSHERHTNNLQAACQILREMFPHMKITLLLQDIDAARVEEVTQAHATLQGPPDLERFEHSLIDSETAPANDVPSSSVDESIIDGL